MKKFLYLLPLLAVIVCALAVLPGQTSAYFTHMDTAHGTSGAAGSLEVSVEGGMSGYGVPGDIMKGDVTVTNHSTIAVDYDLFLTVDAETAKMLDTTSDDAIRLYCGNTELDTELPPQTDNTIKLLYKGTLQEGGNDQLTVALTFKGESLIDGNTYQKQAVKITHEVYAYQANTAEVGVVNNEETN